MKTQKVAALAASGSAQADEISPVTPEEKAVPANCR